MSEQLNFACGVGEYERQMGLGPDALAYPKASVVTQPLTSQGFSPVAYAQAIISQRHVHIVDGMPIVWNGTMYETGADRLNRAMIQCFPGIRSAQRREIMEYLMLCLDDEPMADARYIAFSNGVYDLEDGRLLENSPDFLIPNTIPHPYDPDAVCPELDAILDQWACGRDDVRANLEEVLGLVMYRGREFHIIPLLLGEGGNGKSSYMHLAQGMLGHGNYGVIDPAELGRSFNRTALMGMLANFADDMSRDRLKGDAASFLRKLASGDEIDAEHKYGSRFKFRPYSTPILSCNEFPGAKDDSAGWWRRFRAIPFDASFVTGEAGANVDLGKILSSEAAYIRAITLGIRGLQRVMEQRDLTPLQDRAELMDGLRRESSTTYAFACDVLGFGTEDAVDITMNRPGDLYGEYIEYCKGEGIRYPEKRGAFTRKLGNMYNLKSENVRVDGKQGRRFVPKG